MNLMRRIWILAVALGAIVVGYVALTAGRLSLGPALLVLGYCLLLPLYLWRSFREGVGE